MLQTYPRETKLFVFSRDMNRKELKIRKNDVILQLLNFAKPQKAEEKKKKKYLNNILLNQTLNVSLFCTGRYKHSFNLHQPRKLG